MNIIKRLNDIPIRLKFILIYLSCVLLPMIVIYSVFFVRISTEVTIREAVVTDQSLERVQKDVEFLMEGCFSISRDIVVDRNLNEMLDHTYLLDSDYYSVYHSELRDGLQRYQTRYNNVIRISVFTDNNTILAGGDIYKLTENVKGTPWYLAKATDDRKETIVPWVEEEILTPGRYDRRLSVVRKMDEYIQYTQYNKYLKIDIDLASLEEKLNNDETMDYVIVNELNEVVAYSERLKIEDNSDELKRLNLRKIRESNEIVEKNIFNAYNFNWRIYGITPKDTLSSQINKYGTLILLLFLISFALSGVMIYLFSGSYNKRIQVLQKHMVQVQEGDYSLIEIDPGRDEIGFLIKTFNSTTDKLNGLVNKVLKLEIKDKEYQVESLKAELNFLQSQMDPHFLFNTLNAILVVCNRKKYTEITEIIKYLSKTLRRLLVWDDMMVTIKDELEFTEMYLKIEKFRFQDKFDYSIDLEEGAKNYKLPKMSIQPFVENACKHGIQATKELGHVHIRIYETKEQVYVVIKDNGIGMEAYVIDHLFDDENTKSIGIKNVYKRLKLNYPNAFDMRIKSAVGEGTTVTLILPKGVDAHEG